MLPKQTTPFPLHIFQTEAWHVLERRDVNLRFEIRIHWNSFSIPEIKESDLNVESGKKVFHSTVEGKREK